MAVGERERECRVETLGPDCRLETAAATSTSDCVWWASRTLLRNSYIYHSQTLLGTRYWNPKLDSRRQCDLEWVYGRGHHSRHGGRLLIEAVLYDSSLTEFMVWYRSVCMYIVEFLLFWSVGTSTINRTWFKFYDQHFEESNSQRPLHTKSCR